MNIFIFLICLCRAVLPSLLRYLEDIPIWGLTQQKRNHNIYTIKCIYTILESSKNFILWFLRFKKKIVFIDINGIFNKSKKTRKL